MTYNDKQINHNSITDILVHCYDLKICKPQTEIHQPKL